MRKFDYSFLNNGLLPARLLNLTVDIASLKTMARVRKEEYQKVFSELELAYMEAKMMQQSPAGSLASCKALPWGEVQSLTM